MHFSGSAFWLWNSRNIPRHLVASDNGWCSLSFVSWESICKSGGDHPVGTRVLSLQTRSVIEKILRSRHPTTVKWLSPVLPVSSSDKLGEKVSVLTMNNSELSDTNSEIKWPKCDKDILLAVHYVIMFSATHSVTCIVSKLLCIHLEAAVMDLLLQCFKCLSVLTTCTNSLGFVPLSHGSQISEAAQLWSLYAMNEPHTCKPQSMQACSIPQGKKFSPEF